MIKLGIFGDQRVAHSLSPRMHGAVMRARGLEGVYLPFCLEASQLPAALAGIQALGFTGVNVTVPHKEAVAALLPTLSPIAALLGAVNTVLVGPQGMEGHNTDLEGFTVALERAGLGGATGPALVVGAGGAARAVVAGLKQRGHDPIWVAGRDPAKVKTLTDQVGGQPASLPEAPDLARQAQLLVNVSSVSSPAEGPALAALAQGLRLPAGRLVVDINYGRQENFWARLASAQGLAFMDGLPMLVLQARASFALWTGLEPSAEEFFAALEMEA